MTEAQSNRIIGFNASLQRRGVLLLLDGTKITFQALIEDLGQLNTEFEVSKDRRTFAKVHILSTSPGLDSLTANSTLIELDPATYKPCGREFQVTDKEPHDIKIVFHAVATYRDQSI